MSEAFSYSSEGSSVTVKQLLIFLNREPALLYSIEWLEFGRTSLGRCLNDRNVFIEQIKQIYAD